MLVIVFLNTAFLKRQVHGPQPAFPSTCSVNRTFSSMHGRNASWSFYSTFLDMTQVHPNCFSDAPAPA